MRRAVLLERVRRIGASDAGARAVRGAAPATAEEAAAAAAAVADAERAFAERAKRRRNRAGASGESRVFPSHGKCPRGTLGFG